MTEPDHGNGYGDGDPPPEYPHAKHTTTDPSLFPLEADNAQRHANQSHIEPDMYFFDHSSKAPDILNNNPTFASDTAKGAIGASSVHFSTTLTDTDNATADIDKVTTIAPTPADTEQHEKDDVDLMIFAPEYSSTDDDKAADPKTTKVTVETTMS